MLVTDAIAAAPRTTARRRSASSTCRCTKGAVRGPDGVLAGSVLTMIEAVRNLHELGAPLEEAVGAATLAPARLLGDPELGRIDVGLPADLVVLERPHRDRARARRRRRPRLRLGSADSRVSPELGAPSHCDEFRPRTWSTPATGEPRAWRFERMSQSLKSVNVITLFVEDPLRSKEFYDGIFDVAGIDEGHGTVIYPLDNVLIRLLRRAEAENEMLGQVAVADRGQA